MGRNIADNDILSKSPVYVSGETRIAVGVSLTATVTIVDISGAGILSALILDNATDTSQDNKILTQVTIDDVRCISATASLITTSYAFIGAYAEQIPFSRSVKVAVKSSGPERSLSLVAYISYRTV